MSDAVLLLTHGLRAFEAARLVAGVCAVLMVILAIALLSARSRW